MDMMSEDLKGSGSIKRSHCLASEAAAVAPINKSYALMKINAQHVLFLDFDGVLHPDAVYLSRKGPTLRAQVNCSCG